MATFGFRKGAKMERFEAAMRDPEKALKRIGVLMQAETMQAFEDQEFGGEAWEPRAEPGVFGILADFKAGASAPPARRFETRPALKDTGELANRVAFTTTTKSVTIGWTGELKERARVHHTGDNIESVEMTGEIRRRLWKWLKGQDAGKKRSLGRLLNKVWLPDGTTLKGKVPKRTLVGITATTREYVREAVGVELFEVKG